MLNPAKVKFTAARCSVIFKTREMPDVGFIKSNMHQEQQKKNPNNDLDVYCQGYGLFLVALHDFLFFGE